MCLHCCTHGPRKDTRGGNQIPVLIRGAAFLSSPSLEWLMVAEDKPFGDLKKAVVLIQLDFALECHHHLV